MSQDPWPEVTAAEAIAARGIADEAEYEAVLKRIDDWLESDTEEMAQDQVEALTRALEAYRNEHGWEPLRARGIQSEAEYQAALKRLDELMDAEPGTPEGAELDALANAAVAYELASFEELFRV